MKVVLNIRRDTWIGLDSHWRKRNILSSKEAERRVVEICQTTCNALRIRRKTGNGVSQH